MTEPVPSGWYDKVFSVSSKEPASMQRYRAHLKFVVDHCIGYSVLDLGCGMGLLSNMIGDVNYTGVDFSHFCIEYAKTNCHNPNASFLESKIEEIDFDCAYDTVVLSEILEHVDNPEEIVAVALKYCLVAVVGSVPIAMPMECHVKPNWTAKDIVKLFGDEPTVLEKGCSGTHWHFVYYLTRE